MSSCFRSTYHPGSRPAAHVVSEALVQPLALFAIPLMIGTTAAVLLGQSIVLSLAVGLPLVLGGASVVAHFRLGQLPAEVCLRGGEAALRSVRDIIYGTPRQWRPLYDARLEATQTTLTIGWQTLRCTRNDWPEHDALQTAVRDARRPMAPPSQVSS